MKRLFGLLAAAALLSACARGRPRVLPPGEFSPQSSSRMPAATAVISADFSKLGSPISRDLYGASMATWSNDSAPGIAQNFHRFHLNLVRWPGGSESDAYHWNGSNAQNAGPNAGGLCGNNGYIATGSTFDEFVQKIAIPAKLDIALTANYGSNPACNGGGDPHEAAAWVAYAKSKGYAVKYMTVGNEGYGPWEYDLHTKPHDGPTYAAAVKTGYYPLIKAADSRVKVGVVVVADAIDYPGWDDAVLAGAKFDFVEYHYYAQAPGNESDAYLLNRAPQNFDKSLAALRAGMRKYGAGNVPIYVGELNSVYSNPGKQSVSITNGLFAAMALMTMAKQNVQMATWWLAYGDCDTGNNNSSSLYGWQDFGAYTLFSDGLPEPYTDCANIPEHIPANTPFPPARAYAVVTHFAPPGARLAAVSVPSGLSLVRAYAVKTANGYAYLLLNLSQTASANVTIAATNAGKSSFTATTLRYDKAIYDASKNGKWLPPVSKKLGTVTLPYALMLPPYSMTAIELH